MKNITNIKQISNNKYSLVIEGKKHIVYDDVLLEYKILKKGPIDDDVYENIIKSSNYHEAYNKILKYLAVKMRTKKEIQTKLNVLKVSKELQNQIISRLEEEGYLEENVYINAYINDKLLLTLNGPGKILYDLKKLGFNDGIVEEHLSNIADDIWYERAKKVLNKKLKSNHTLSKNAFILKLKKEYLNLGYSEKHYNFLLTDIDFDDSIQLKKDCEKLRIKLSRKYSSKELNFKLKQKLYQLGYDVDSISKIIDFDE
jgi:regulatory protein